MFDMLALFTDTAHRGWVIALQCSALYLCGIDLGDVIAGYLHDHRIQGQVLLPGAAMFEMSCAAARCMNTSALPSLLLGVSISAPCVLEDMSSAPARNHKMLSCAVAYGTGRMEVRSFTAASSLAAAAGQRGQLHLGGWAGQAAVASESSHQGQQHTKVSLLSKLLIKATADRVELPTAVANLVSEPMNACGQPGGYAVHPASLDSATHTAAAFSGQDTTDKGDRPCLLISVRCSAI